LGAQGKSAIGTLVERTTRFAMLLHLPDDHGAVTVQQAIVAKMAALPAILRKTLTWDQGHELANHIAIAEAAQLDIYFCDPHSPWQRGTNENTYWCTVLGPDGFDGSQSGGLLGDSENTCRTWLSVDLSTAA
jgi:IS30 family transposase